MTEFEHYQAIAQHQLAVSRVLTELLVRLPDENGSCNYLADLVKSAQSELTGATTSMPSLLQLIPADKRTTPAGERIADKTFRIPELFERILCYLDVPELLRAQQVSHLFFDTIQDSPNLQRCMGLAPDTKHGFRLTVKSLTPAFWFLTDANEYAYGNVEGDNILVRANIQDCHSLPQLGERARDVLICQPPLKIMNCYTGCCSDFFEDITAPPTKVLKSDTGITLGDLIDAAHALQHEHELCPHAPDYIHDSRGKVIVNIHFEGTVSVPASDRTLLKKRKLLEAATKDQEEQQTLRARLLPYLAAKVAGKSHF